ncbi:hypothetical protein VTO73DRAFT_12372 [Trametes versicolor]
MGDRVPRTPPRRPLALATQPPTPRRRKQPISVALQGTKPLTSRLQPSALAPRLKTALKLSFDPDPWQLELLSRLLRGFDSILCAGTGYGKSLIFEGLAVLSGSSKLVIVISPLKALERDQMQQASAKGIRAAVLNEDNSHEAKIWETARKTAQLLYVSPEMSLSDGFVKLWKDSAFRKRLAAVVVDEAHCVSEWSDDDFRPSYRALAILRHYTGMTVPFLACTATCQSATFEDLYSSLGFGDRPFWGLDVGCDRPNLFYDIRILANPRNPALDVLDILPSVLDITTPSSALPKSILYFDSEIACRVATDTLRRCLPRHLRDTVYSFSSVLSERAKMQCWDRFQSGRYRIICATDAAGMGCNVPDIQYIVIINCPKSLSVVAQRWGRAGRNRTTHALCILLVPVWALRPSVPSVPHPVPALGRLKGQTKHLLEPKKHTQQRDKLPRALEEFINTGQGSRKGDAASDALVWRHGVRATHPIMLLPGPVSRRTFYASFLLSFHQQEPLPKAPVQDSMDDDSQEYEP